MRSFRRWVSFFCLVLITLVCASAAIIFFIAAASPSGSAGGSIILIGGGLVFCGISVVVGAVAWLFAKGET